MASATHLLSSFLFAGFLFASIIADSGPTPYSKCPSFDCGDGLAIHYPFWTQSQNSDHCGYPGLNLSCIGKKPMLQFSNSLYQIKTINYSSNSLVLAYTEFSETNCPEINHLVSPSNTTIPSLFNYTFGNEILNFFYNCTLSPPSIPHIPCLEYASKHSYVFVDGSIPEFDWHTYCESTVKVPVLDKAINGDVVQSFGEALRDGFRLSWQKPDGLCQSCEATGGFCDYTTGQRRNFCCVCTDGLHLTNCNDKAAPTRHEQNYVAIGGLIFGGLVIAATAFYLVQKRKISSYKPV